MRTRLQICALALAFATAAATAPAAAQSRENDGATKPVVAEGVVPDQATKAQILDKLRALYGAQRVVDNIQVQTIPTPPNWGRYIGGMLTPGLKQVSDGKLEVDGQSVRISGLVANEAQRQQVASGLSTASNRLYTVTNSLRIGGGIAPQAVLDSTLANRIIEFESGSAQLTQSGARLLDEMARKMRPMGALQVQIVGHTDTVGTRPSNIILSAARAEAVRSYLMQQGIDVSRFSVSGRGPDEPVADNFSDQGRARNRRIEFKVLEQ